MYRCCPRKQMRTVGMAMWILVALAVLPPVEVSTQPETDSLLGSWSLVRESGDLVPSPDVGGRRGGRGRGGGFGVGGGRFGGGGRGAGRSGGDPNARAEAREEAQRLAALMGELLTPSTSWLIGREEGDTLAFTTADGRTVRYTPNNKTEKHQLINGTIETKSKWSDRELRQEIEAPGGIAMVRVFGIDQATGRLVVTTTVSGRGGKDRPYRVLYEHDDR